MYRIATIRNFYLNSIGSGNPLSFSDEKFDTIQKAKEEIEGQESIAYVLDNNEAERPELLIVSDIVAEWIISGRCDDGSNYDWEENECGCGCCEDCYDMMNDQDLEYIRKHAEKEEPKEIIQESTRPTHEEKIWVYCENGDDECHIRKSQVAEYSEKCCPECGGNYLDSQDRDLTVLNDDLWNADIATGGQPS